MTKHRRSWLMAIFAALVLPLVWAPAAHAISKIKIREVYSGTNDDSYVELEAYDYWGVAGETLPGKSLVLFDPAGNPTIRFTFVKGDDLGSYNTMFLVGDTGVEQTFGLTPNVVDPDMEIDPAAGAACWNVGDTPVDCASWGAFTGEAKLEAYSESKAGNPALPGGIPAGKVIRRTIARNCPTWLEIEDDTDDSATDFFEADPDPHTPGNWPSENGEAIERECESGMPDDTAFVAKPGLVSNSGNAHFTYSATGATSFQCKLDTAPRYSTCSSGGQDYTGLAEGFHLFEVRALNGYGYDKSPAAYVWRVDTQAPFSEFLTRPGSQSFGRSAVFTFASNEPEATFLCSLDGAPSSPCVSGIRLTSLSTGPHTFTIAAVDAAGNVQVTPTSFAWSVNADQPQTTIDAKPGNPSASTMAAFTYHANRTDTVFECSLDGAAFSSCPTGSATYVGLAKGSHTFSVRAIDSDDEVEASPPSYSFTIAAPRRARTCKKGRRRKVVRGVVKCVKKPQHKRNTQRR
jgi:hypothetical protein